MNRYMTWTINDMRELMDRFGQVIVEGRAANLQQIAMWLRDLERAYLAANGL